MKPFISPPRFYKNGFGIKQNTKIDVTLCYGDLSYCWIME